MKNKTEIQKRLSHHIVSKPVINNYCVNKLLCYLFQETQRILESNIFEKDSELLKLSIEMREKSDEITHLKTREVSLIDKSDTLENGQIMNIIYYM